jgi:D-sedoheptulose 7-phosphate isomerase
MKLVSVEMRTHVGDEFRSHLDVAERAAAQLGPLIATASDLLVTKLAEGGKLLVFGNGGSAADSQHIAAELAGRYQTDRPGLPAIALTTDTSALTAIANDHGYSKVFARQVEALANPADLVLAISTSGNSPNVLNGVEAARTAGCGVIGLTGRDGGALAAMCDVAIVVPAQLTSRIQEMHILIGHIFCGAVDQWYATKKSLK